MLRHFAFTDGIIPVVRRIEAKFRKPANGALTSTATVRQEALDELGADLATKGRAFVGVSVDLHDESGAHTLSAVVEWFIQRVSPNDRIA